MANKLNTLVSKKQLTSMEKYLRIRPRSAKDLITHETPEYIHVLRKLNKTVPVLTIRVWDTGRPSGLRFMYWIRPGRMGKNWQKIYATLKAPYSYDVTVDNYDVQYSTDEV